MNTRQPQTSLPAAAPAKPGLRVSDLAHFASRINRGLKVDVESHVVIVTPSDDLETLRYQDLHLEVGRINDLLRHGGIPNLLIDLSEVCQLDPVILSALLGFCRANSGLAAFCCLPDQVGRSPWRRSLLQLWPTYASRSEGIQALSMPPGNRPSD